MTDGGFIDMINSVFGGAVTTLIGAFTGRLMWHSGEVKLGNRRFLVSTARAFRAHPTVWACTRSPSTAHSQHLRAVL